MRKGCVVTVHITSRAAAFKCATIRFKIGQGDVPKYLESSVVKMCRGEERLVSGAGIHVGNMIDEVTLKLVGVRNPSAASAAENKHSGNLAYKAKNYSTAVRIAYIYARLACCRVVFDLWDRCDTIRVRQVHIPAQAKTRRSCA